MTKHYITKAAINASEALMNAMYISQTRKLQTWDMQGVDECIEMINKASLSLSQLCRLIEFTRSDKAKILNSTKTL